MTIFLGLFSAIFLIFNRVIGTGYVSLTLGGRYAEYIS